MEAAYSSSLEHICDEIARIDVLLRGQVMRARSAAIVDAWRGEPVAYAEIDALLSRTLGAPRWDHAGQEPSLADAHALADRSAATIDRRCARSAVPLRLVQLARRFGLSRFELDVLLVALAPELDLKYERIFGYLHDDGTRARPTVDLAMHLLCRTLPERIAARARFGATAPLVRHELVHLLADPTGVPLIAHALKVDDRIVDWLHGSGALDPALARVSRRVEPQAMLGELELASEVRDQLFRLVDDPAIAEATDAPILYLQGPAGVGKRTVAEAIATALRRDLFVLDARALDGLTDDAARSIVRAAAREARLGGDLFSCEGADRILADDARRGSRDALLDAIAAARGPSVLAGEAPWEPTGALGRPFVRVALAPPDTAAQRRLWEVALVDAPLAPDVDVALLAARMRLTGGQIHDAAATARGLAHLRGGPAGEVTATDLAEACRRHVGHRLGAHARKIDARAAWEDLILPGDRVMRLREICDHAHHRATVLERWGFDRMLPGGAGLGALFTGAPGTGKLLAASVIATELGLDLYRIDLASVDRLDDVFASAGRAVLFFAGASDDLLARIEAFDGIAIVAGALDETSVRRLRFVVEFPLPDERERLRIWERIWPAEVPRDADLDLPALAHGFELAGAHIRNIALSAAFLAAAEGAPVCQRHALHAARRECEKLGRATQPQR